MELAKSKFIEWAGPGYEHVLRIDRHLYRQRDIEGRKILDIGAGNGERSGAFILFFGAALSDAVDLWGGGMVQKYQLMKKLFICKRRSSGENSGL
jgi:hypothetical protein